MTLARCTKVILSEDSRVFYRLIPVTRLFVASSKITAYFWNVVFH